LVKEKIEHERALNESPYPKKGTGLPEKVARSPFGKGGNPKKKKLSFRGEDLPSFEKTTFLSTKRGNCSHPGKKRKKKKKRIVERAKFFGEREGKIVRQGREGRGFCASHKKGS